MNLKKFVLNLIVILFPFSSIAEEKILKDFLRIKFLLRVNYLFEVLNLQLKLKVTIKFWLRLVLFIKYYFQ